MCEKYSIEKNKDIIGRIAFHEQLNIDADNCFQKKRQSKKVFIIFTGGTIGMFPNKQNKYAPEQNRFKNFLNKFPYFCDEDQTYFNSVDDFLITPPSIGNQPIMYKFYELDDLIDSTNMNIERLNLILEVIEKNYDSYDSFIILHGTDTMSYTASALSFMIENLKKTVVLTGAQVPIGETRNDALNNLLCSLTIAGHYSIPEVVIVFDNKILRGNRSTKFTTASFDAFTSPNYYPIGIMGLTISIQWQKIFPSNQDLKTSFVKLKQEVELIKLTPFGFKTPPTNRYVVLESYGIGNVSTKGDFYEWMVENSKLPEEKRKVIVNISQVYQSVITSQYEAGYTAYKLGLIPGSDMTCEAAISKLSYLVSKGHINYSQISELMCKNLRGELTEEEDRFTKQKDNYIVNCLTTLDQHGRYRSERQKQILASAIYPHFLFEKGSKAAINRLEQFSFNFHSVYPDGSNLLHKLMKNSSKWKLEEEGYLILDFFLNQKISTTLIDHKGNSAAFYALQNNNMEGMNRILNSGGVLQTCTQRVFKAIRAKTEDENKIISYLIFKGDITKYKDNEERNCVFMSVIHGNRQMFNLLKNATNLMDEEALDEKDIYGQTVKDYCKDLNFPFEQNNKDDEQEEFQKSKEQQEIWQDD